jgi:predicted transglutaminase-like cysteine proteinase
MNKILQLENKVFQGTIKESYILQLLHFYKINNRAKKFKNLVELALQSNIRSKKILEIAISYFLHQCDYKSAYYYSEALCYQYDRTGESLLQLAHSAILLNNYNIASNWLEEYIQHNNLRPDIAYLYLGDCALRQHFYRDALNYYKKSNINLNNIKIDWLSSIAEDGKKPIKKNWLGEKIKPMPKLIKINWKNDIINHPLNYYAETFNDIDKWINFGTYVSDQRLYGEADKWISPSKFENIRQGDCEDFALWVWVQLIKMKVNARFVLGGLFTNEIDHAWVSIYTRNDVKVFECTPNTHNIQISSKNTPEYLPIYSIDKYLNHYKH